MSGEGLVAGCKRNNHLRVCQSGVSCDGCNGHKIKASLQNARLNDGTMCSHPCPPHGGFSRTFAFAACGWCTEAREPGLPAAGGFCVKGSVHGGK